MTAKHTLSVPCPDPLMSLRIEVRRRFGRPDECHWTMHRLTAIIRSDETGHVIWRAPFDCLWPLTASMDVPIAGPAVLHVQHEEPDDSTVVTAFNGAWLP